MQHTFMQQRRQFTKTMLGLGLASCLVPFAHGSSKLKPMKFTTGIQLYTLRDLMAQDPIKALNLVAKTGYQEVEFAGYFNKTTQELASTLRELGLTAPSAHYGLDDLNANLSQIIEDAHTLGHKYIVLPYLTDEQRDGGIDTYKKLAVKCNKFGEACKQADIQFAYHHHDFEFFKTHNQVPFDVLLNETDADLMKIEMDLYWMAKANQSPTDYFKKHPQRFPLFHVKDMDAQGDFADVGTGVLDFDSIFAQHEISGIQHFFVERDHTLDVLKTMATGQVTLSKLLRNLAVTN